MVHSASDQDRFWCSLPGDDPRFGVLRARVLRLRGRGRSSPIPRMLGEYALLGFLLTSGQLAVPGAAPADDIVGGAAPPDVLEVTAAALREFTWD